MYSRRRSPTRRMDSYGRRPRIPRRYENTYESYVLDRLYRERERRRRERAMNIDENDLVVAQPIEVDAVEFYCKDNGKTHQTSSYDLVEGKEPSPVVRRGQPFFLAVRFKRGYNISMDKVSLEFAFGPNKSVEKGTLVQLPVTSKTAFTKDKTNWDICTSQQEKTIVTVQIQIPYTVGVGMWRLKILTQTSTRGRLITYKCKENIYILFNPWCKDDPVYMFESTWRQEYVLNDVGKIYMGSFSKPVGRPWIYGQFAEACLPASILLLEKSGLDYVSRGNPVKVVRAISAMVNSNDDDGVVVGNWSGTYDDGSAPYSWTGSTAILEKYLASGGVPVKYGQCWVFAGVCTTVCRALGIPCRTTTNYVSAHDTDDSLTVDIYLDRDGDPIKEKNFDSIWNFHCWNDCWMTRPDLPTGYGGWQAVDSTPQETSEGVFRAGPTSLVAVRKGEIGYMYDAPFVFAEVNADIIHWQKDEKSNTGWKKLKTNTYHVGRMLVTKRMGFDDDFGDRDMEIISHEYKSQEGTPDERMAVMIAARRGGVMFIHDLPPPSKEDVRMSLRDIEKVMIGKPFQVVVDVQNLSDEKRTVQAVLSASTVYYTGIIARKVKRARGSFVLMPRQKEQLGIEVTVDDYLEKLVDYSMLKIYAIATVKETQQTWADEDDFQVEKPILRIDVEGIVRLYRRFNVRISFANPLNKTLQDCQITIEGPGLAEPHKTSLEDVPPYGIMSHIETLAPRKTGPRKITAIFSSRELIEVNGSKHVEVLD